jgi:ABC-type branched-subunit amino acid transport system substrate-binding protein
MMKSFAAALGAVSMLALSGAAQAQFKTQGVTADEIVIGTHMDLSGPIKSWGVPSANGAKLAVDQINAAGGIHGRKLRLVVEDDGYDPKKAVLATQKLIEKDKIFSMVAPMGSATTLAPLPNVLEAGITHLFPITAAEFTFKMEPGKPQERLKFNIFLPYYDSMRIGLKYVINEKKPKNVCIIYQDDEMGKNFTDAYKDQLKAMNIKEGTLVSFKRGATDFSSQVAKLKSDNCDLVALGSVVRESIGILTTAKKAGFESAYVVSSPSYVPELPDLGKEYAEGVYGVGSIDMFDPPNATGKVKEFLEAYQKAFGVPANLQTTAGYNGVMAFAHFANLAGKDLTTEKLVEAMESGKAFDDIFGQPAIKFSKDNHLGVASGLVAQVKGGKWVTLARDQKF